MLTQWQDLCEAFTPEDLGVILRRVAPGFRPERDFYEGFIHDETFGKATQIGVIELGDAQTVIVGAIHVKSELIARLGRRKQYDLAKTILRYGNHNGGLFVFYDDYGRFRFSLVTVTYHGVRRRFSTFRRYTFFIDPQLSNKTFLQQMQHADFSSISGLLEAFSIQAVSDEFYKDFKGKYDALAVAVQGTDAELLKHDFALLFAIRIIFLGFVQKKGWLGNNPKFLQNYLEEYLNSKNNDAFYNDWLQPLFFEAFSSPPGNKPHLADGIYLSEKTQKALMEAPYLNGELFKRKPGVDDCGLWIPDQPIREFFDFLFQYNFTVEENELYDEELELNPEFLGIIFERITNKDQGAVYTPRLEVDLMCRLALVKWLEQNSDIEKENLYQLFFGEIGAEEFHGEYQKPGNFTSEQIRTLIERLENVTVCDPAAGSGAFEVGMLQVLEQILEKLYTRDNTPEDLKVKTPSRLERRKAIIARSLYGVEVKRWAVWINHLRLWLALFVDMPNEFKSSSEPLLPNLTFKVRTGDSLVQRIGNKTFPVIGDANLSSDLKRKIVDLKQKKLEFFYNKEENNWFIEREELAVFQLILNHEIEERKKLVKVLRLSNYEQLAFFEADIKQASLLDHTEQIKRLEMEIEELEAQERNLKDERPFIWSIEFPEIFFDCGGFDVVIGNPPYLRQEHIVDPTHRLGPKLYKEALQEMVRLDFPDYFAKSPAELDKFQSSRRPSGRSDLYTYFYVRSLRLLNAQGVHVFICSNAWLDVAYGAWLQEFYLRQVPLDFVIDNHARRSFARADINTIITVSSAPKKTNDEQHMVRFVAFKRPFEDLVLLDDLLAVEQAKETVHNENLRVLPMTVGELLQGGSKLTKIDGEIHNSSGLPWDAVAEAATQEVAGPYSPLKLRAPTFTLGNYVGDKWGGKYLRAPDIFFTILEKGKNKLVRLDSIADVRRGFTTGANKFFYLEPLGPGSRPGLQRVRNGAGWEGEIEERFLKPVIKSPRECSITVVRLENLIYHLFACHSNKAELRGSKALEYIRWGENQKYHLRSTLRSRSKWWDLGQRDPGLYLWPMIHYDRLASFVNAHAVQVDHNLFEITPKNRDEHIVTLFSVFSVLVRELLGRSNLGEGALKTEGIDIKGFPAMTMKKNYIEWPPRLEIKSIFIECGVNPESDIPISEQEPNPLPGRRALDDVVFDALGLTEEERKEVYRAVCQLVWDRISKARSV